ncbi:MAG: ATP-binding protein [Acaryochloridaceae cyanobacterium RL_2_7]|nr:ATP-binding protein [Acaryochloridaceae cyanobacterium RL_2_7]
MGRDAELQELLVRLGDRSYPITSIEGLAGIGKTSLAYEAAYRCLQNSQPPSRQPCFDAIIWIYCQSHRISGTKIHPSLNPHRNLRQILQTIQSVLFPNATLPADLKEQCRWILQSLAQHSCLLVIDNLETLEDLNQLHAFLAELPHSTKTLLTSRKHADCESVIRLQPLSQTASLDLIQQKMRDQAIALTQRQQQQLQQQAQGVPLAIAYSMAHVAKFGQIPQLDRSQPGSIKPQNLYNYLFQKFFQTLNPKDKHILWAIAICPFPIALQTLYHIALGRQQPAQPDTHLSPLLQISWIDTLQENSASRRYTIHSITRQFALDQLDQSPALADAICQRRIDWYLKLCSPFKIYIGKNGMTMIASPKTGTTSKPPSIGAVSKTDTKMSNNFGNDSKA